MISTGKAFQFLTNRRVLRTFGIYLATVLVILRLADRLSGMFGISDIVQQVLAVVLLAGLPLAIRLAWRASPVVGLTEGDAEVNTEGETEGKGDVRSELFDENGNLKVSPRMRARAIDFALGVVIAVVIGAVLVDRWIADRLEETVQDAAGIAAEVAAVFAPPEHSIAVLPFVNISGDPEQEYFSDGLAEELLNLLAKVPELQVTSRTSAFAFKGEKIGVREIAEKLNVANVLEGSVRRGGEKVRITTQLIETESDTHLWSETYDRTLEDILAVQDEIAAAVVDQLRITLLDEQLPTARRTTPEVFNLYLLGRQLSRQLREESLLEAMEVLGRAIELDPDYAPARAALGNVQLNYAYINNKEEDYQTAWATLEKAVAMDPELPATWASLAGLVMIRDFDYTLADEYVQRALSLDGENAVVLGRAGILAYYRGDFERAAELIERALRLDPLSVALHNNLGQLFYDQEKYEASLVYYDKANVLSPNYTQSNFFRGRTMLGLGDARAALALFEAEPMDGRRLQGQIMAYWALGEVDESDAALAEFMSEKYLEDEWQPYIAVALAHRGDVDQAFEMLQIAYELREPILLAMIRGPRLKNLHSDPRWPVFKSKVQALTK
jgi:TolB-like protein/Tfp pilus assembly protein PilF